MKLVSIQSPYAGVGLAETERNLAYARRALLDSLGRGEAPFASHLLYTQVLHDDDMKDHWRGMFCDHAFLAKCNLVAVYRDLGISDGMKQALEVALARKIPTDFRNIGYK
jgi:hypothetical protein